MHTNSMSAILADTARDLAYAQRDGKPLGPVQAEGAARIVAHYTAPILKRCRSCADPLLDDRFAYCPKCDRELRGPFEFEGGDE